MNKENLYCLHIYDVISTMDIQGILLPRLLPTLVIR